jgi:hypothetical protein
MQVRIARLAAACWAVRALAVTAGCLSIPTEGQNDLFVEYRFTTEEPEWLTDFVDFPASQEAAVAFVGEYRTLPAGPAIGGLAAYLSGNNISDDLFMFWKRPLTGLRPNGLYDVTISVDFVTNYGRDCQVGNAASVWIKAGLVPGEPSRVLDSEDHYRLNVDKGQQANGSANVLVLGDIRNDEPGCSTSAPFAVNRHTSARHALRVRASEEGDFWVLFGTESGFESPHEIYFTRLRFDLRPVS